MTLVKQRASPLPELRTLNRCTGGRTPKMAFVTPFPAPSPPQSSRSCAFATGGVAPLRPLRHGGPSGAPPPPHPPATGAASLRAVAEPLASSPGSGASAAAPTSAATIADFDAVVMRTYGRYPLVLERGLGASVWDADGKHYVDCVAGIATCSLGHAHPGLIAAVTAQLGRVHHVSNLYYTASQGQLAAWLVANSPADKVFFCNSGAEANEAAIKLARKAWHAKHDFAPPAGASPVIITAEASFHGRTLAAITATGQPKYHKGFHPLVPGFVYTPYNDPEALAATVASVGASNVAAILLEPLQGEGGVHPGSKAFFTAARELCDASGALLMVDEVQTGMGRTGRMWGHQHLDVTPDVVTTAKGLGSGIPVGAMLCAAHCDVFEPGDHASTFGGNPLASAAGLTVADALENGGVMANVGARGEQLARLLGEVAAKYGPGVVSEVRGWGLLVGLELAEGAPFTAGEVVAACMASGLLLVPAGTRVVRFVPPLVISEAEVATAVGHLDAALGGLLAGGK